MYVYMYIYIYIYIYISIRGLSQTSDQQQALERLQGEHRQLQQALDAATQAKNQLARANSELLQKIKVCVTMRYFC